MGGVSQQGVEAGPSYHEARVLATTQVRIPALYSID